MRIIGLVDASGPAYHRIIVPLMALARQGVNCILTDKLTDKHLADGVDVVIFNRLPPAQKVSEVINMKLQHGFKIAVDLDDHWDLDPHHILADFYRQHNLSTYILNSVMAADAVTVTHERLADAVAPYNRNVWVLPNAIDTEVEQFQVQHTTGQLVRLMWAGGITHEPDINILRNPLKRVYGDATLRDSIMMVMGGFHAHEPTWHRMASAFTHGMKLRGFLSAGKHVTEYYDVYRLADICLIPLQQSKFNGYKSNLKILEAANMGLPVIVSAVDPYLNFPEELVNYVHRQTDWYRYIRHLVKDEEYRKAQGAALQQYCEAVFNFPSINQVRKELFEELCKSEIEKH
jgi:glycosyltransferase involved in cell wall biosynthesis